MAKEPSKFSRLDGLTRIPLPGSIRTSYKPTKLVRPSAFSGLRPPSAPVAPATPSQSSILSTTTTVSSLPTSFSGDRLNEKLKVSCLIDNKSIKALNGVRKLVSKADKFLSNDKIIEQPDIDSKNSINCTKKSSSLTRSETFIRDSNNSDIENNLLTITHDVLNPSTISAIASSAGGAKSIINTTTTISTAPKMSSNSSSLFLTRTIDTTPTSSILDVTVTMDASPKLKKDLFNEAINSERLIDIKIPSSCEDLDATLKASEEDTIRNMIELSNDFDGTINLAPDKANMKLVLNSTMNYDKLLDISTGISPSRQFLNITKEMNKPFHSEQNLTKLLCMSTDNLDQTILAPKKINDGGDDQRLLEDDLAMDVDDMPKSDSGMYETGLSGTQILSANPLQDLNRLNKPRFSFGLDLTESTLDCSIELIDVSLSSSVPAQVGSPSLKKQNSFEMDESLGILTPDQMKEFLDSTTTTTNLDLPINMHSGSAPGGGKMTMHQMRIDQTPSPEDLPLDPVGVKTDISDVIMSQELVQPVTSQLVSYPQELSQTDSDSKTDQMTKSNVSKVSNSFITSVTSITSLDTGYQGDGEMSRPASRGAGDHSPSNGPRKPHLGRQPSFGQHNHPPIPIRRQDPMTDSDFFTESDADDIFHRGDRRAQVIDGQLYGPMLQPSNVFITEQPQMEDSCMESSGIFTDVENRCDDDITQSRREGDVDMSPDGSTDTVKSNNTEYNSSRHQSMHQHNTICDENEDDPDQQRSISPASQGHSTALSKSRTSSTIQSSLSCERISVTGGCGVDENLHSPLGEDYPHQLNSHSAISDGVTNKILTQNALASGKTTTGSIGNLAVSKNINNTGKTTKQTKTNEDKKTTNSYKKLQQTTTPPSVSVKKSSPSRKHHGTPGHGAKNENSSIVCSGGKTNVQVSQLSDRLSGSSPTTPSSLINNLSIVNSSGLKQSIALNGGDCGSAGDMLLKNSPKRRDDNQENKRPITSANCNAVSRKLTPNKWDAVMNKIAENKVFKKNYSEVKSRVATGVLRRSPPVLSKSSNGQGSNCGSINSVSGLSTPQSTTSSKRLLQGATKRGRSFSKDSQQSSQSDLSLSGGSPKLQNKPFGSTRSAKKRDVRTLSISPTDLGPPPKTQTNGTPRTKQPILSQKRISPNAAQQTTASPLPGAKGSPPAKKVVSRRPQPQSVQHTKAPLKDHNRLVGQQQQQQSQQPQQQNSTNSCSPKSGGIKGTTTSSQLSSCGGSTKTTANNRSSQSPALNKTCSSNNNNNSISSNPPTSIVQQDYKQKQQKSDEHQQNLAKDLFNIHISHASHSVQALGVLLQYLVYDLDAFATPKLKREYEKTQKKLFESNLLLEDAKVTCHDLQDQLHDKEAYYRARESELQSLHQCELKKVETSLSEIEKSAKERISALEQEILNKDALNEKRFKDYVSLSEEKLVNQQKKLESAKDKEQELLKRISVLSTTETELRHRVKATENEFAERLHSAAQRERDLADKVNFLNKQLDQLRHNTEHRERELEEKLNLSHDEISILRHSRNSLDQQPLPTQRNSLNSSTNSIGNGGTNGPNSLHMLQDEVESLRCVLELKQSEISDLRKHNLELQRVADELPASQMKISALESRIEDLQIQLKARVEEEKELIQKNKVLHESYTHELKNRNRLSLHNEELQWRLKQNSEKFALALTELSKSYQDQSGFLNMSKASIQSHDNSEISSQNSSRLSLNRTNGSDRMVGCFQMDDVSPPTSPIIKGVVEKSDSVSWVLEMEDESPEALATRMIKRAGSFRSSFNEKSPITKRQLSSPAQGSLTVGNPLTQSASATSVLRQHSNETVGTQPQAGSNGGIRPGNRIRSKSVTIKMSDQNKLVRQNSIGGGSSSSRKIELSSSWKEPVCSSSPYTRRYTRSPPKQMPPSPIALSPGEGTSYREKTFCADSDGTLYRKQPRNLITCDTSALTSAERMEMRSMPSHPSVQDLKCLKKCQEIQESAGEAMVSGTNSEDEGCSASSDETVSSSTSSSLGGKRHMSIEDALLMDKISTTSLGGTPMEVSWSEDADQYPSESIV